MPDRRHRREKRKTVSIPLATMFHQSQLPAIPLRATRPVTTRGVSAAKVVATIEVPASHQGTLRPERKNSLTLPPARRPKAIPSARLSAKKPTTTAQSRKVNRTIAPSRPRAHGRAAVAGDGLAHPRQHGLPAVLVGGVVSAREH